jgi:hypothetical protein
MIRKIINIIIPIVLAIMTINVMYISYERWGYPPWKVITPHWTEAATAAMMVMVLIPVVYGLSVMSSIQYKRNNRQVFFHVLACSSATTAISTITCAATFISLHSYKKYIFITKSFLPYYWIVPIFISYLLIYYLADLIEIRLYGKLISFYNSWIIFVAFTPLLAMFYEVFRLEIFGWQLMPNGGETLLEATIRAYLSTLHEAALKSVILTPFYVLFTPFINRFEHA